MDENRVYGTAKNLTGKAEEGVGYATGDVKRQVEGRVKQAARCHSLGPFEIAHQTRGDAQHHRRLPFAGVPHLGLFDRRVGVARPAAELPVGGEQQQ